MSNYLIKICGISDPEIASEAAKCGANFIGLIFHPLSKRYVDVTMAKCIAAAAKEQGAQPVAVFVDASAAQMLAICQATDIQIVQLHGDRAQREHIFLPKLLQRIYVCTVNSEGFLEKNSMDEYSIKALDKTRDYLLFDSKNPGSSESFSWNNFTYEPALPWFLAGGLNTSNVKDALHRLNPYAVDVSSGVENAQGEKEIGLIRDFIGCVSL